MSLIEEAELENHLQLIDLEWSLIGGAILTRVYTFEDFKGALKFVNSISDIAEELNHHPDIELSFGKVTINLTTHSEGGLTDKDFDFAKKVDSQHLA